jgi:repressor LexA
MIDAGIHEGDRVVVEKASRQWRHIVVISSTTTHLKRLAREKRPHRPQTETAYPVIRPKEDAEIYGVVVGLVRKY